MSAFELNTQWYPARPYVGIWRKQLWNQKAGATRTFTPNTSTEIKMQDSREALFGPKAAKKTWKKDQQTLPQQTQLHDLEKNSRRKTRY